jgi:PAS domain S-box-containing protein
MDVNILLRPVILLMNRLPYRRQLALICLYALAVMGVLIFHLVNSSISHIVFAEKEIAGIEYLRPLTLLMRDIQTYRQAEKDYFNGKNNSKGLLFTTLQNIEIDIHNVDELDLKYGESLKTTKSWNQIKDLWLKKLSDNSTKSDFGYYTLLIDYIINLATDVYDKSNLTLDPVMETNYLMDTYATKLSAFIETAYRIQSYGADLIRNNSISARERSELMALKTEMLDFDAPKILRNLHKVINANPSLSNELEDSIDQFKEGTASIIELLEGLDANKKFEVSEETYINKFDNIIDTSYVIEDKLLDLVQLLVKKRISQLKRTFYISLIIEILALLTLLYMFLGLAHILLDKESKTHAILESTVDGIMMINQNNEIEACNNSAAALFECPPNMLIGEKINNLVTDVLDRKSKNRIEDVDLFSSDASENKSYEAKIIQKDNSVNYIEIIISEIQSTGYSLYVLRDISEEKLEEMYTKMRQGITEILNEALSFEVIIPKILQTLGEIMGLEIGVAWHVNEDRNELIYSNLWMNEKLQNDLAIKEQINDHILETTQIGEKLVGRVLEDRQADLARRVRLTHSFDELDELDEENVTYYSAFAFPIFLQNNIIGIFEFFFPTDIQLGVGLLRTLSDISVQISVYITREHSAAELKQSTLRLTAQYDTMRALSDALTIQELSSKLLKAICDSLNWQLGSMWLVDSNNKKVSCVGVWKQENLDIEQFESTTLAMHLDKGAALPGQVWSSGQPIRITIEDGIFSEDYERFGFAKSAGLNFAFAFPILLKNKVLGAIEIFTREMQHFDSTLHNMFASIGLQVGQFIQRKEIENELLDSNTYKTAVLEAASDSILTTTLSGKILSFNSITCGLFRCSKEDMHNQNLMTFIPGLTAEILALDKLNFTEYVAERKDHVKFPAELSFTKISFNDQIIIVCSIRDITERKKIEKMKSEFISVVSHELRTPLTSIKGAMGLMQGRFSDSLPEKGKQLLDIANKNCERLILLINDILDIEKTESGRMVFKFAVINLKSIIEDSLNAIEEYAKKFNVKVLTENVQDLYVYADYDRLMQVMLNLLSNAIKFSRENGKVIVEMETLNQNVRVLIKDKGKGIPDEFKPKLFEKFVQVDSSSTRGISGTGLGLSICKAIIEAQQGKIGFSSEENVGSIFYFELPLYEAEKPSETDRSE